MKAKVSVQLKNGVLDPQAKAVLQASHSLGFEEIQEIRMGKFFEIESHGNDAAQFEKSLDDLGKKLLSNPVIENFKVEILES